LWMDSSHIVWMTEFVAYISRRRIKSNHNSISAAA
jgi:hypothetical protein